MKTTDRSIQNPLRPTAARAPIRVRLAIAIPAPRDVVFDYLADLENNSEWNWSVAATTAIGGPVGEGRRFVQQRVSARSVEDLLEITEFHPPRLLEINGHLGEGDVGYRYELSALDADRTRLLTTVELTPNVPMAGAPLYTARLEDAVSTNLESLRAVFIGREVSVPMATFR